MPARYIDSDIWADEWFSELSFFEQALWIGLFSKCADNQGRLRDNAALVRSAVFPTRDVPLAEIEAALAKFAEAWRILRYKIDGKPFLQILRWWDHQCPRFATPSEFPAPPGWQDHVKATIRGQVIKVNWANPEEHARLAREWIASYRARQGGSIESSVQSAVENSPAADNNPDPDPGPEPGPEPEKRLGADNPAPPAPNPGDDDPPSDNGQIPPKTRAPSQQDQIRGALMAHFCAKTGIDPPAMDTEARRKTAGHLWWGPLREIGGLAGWDVDVGTALIDKCLDALKGLTVSDPNSIVKTARAQAGQLKRKSDRSRYVGGRYGDRVRH